MLVHCHDIGDLIGCYPGNSADTPRLDELAAQGVVLERHFAAAPQCSPSRASMMTGLFPHRNGLMGLQNNGAWDMGSEQVTISDLLRDLGYATASFGIWHISQDLEPFGVEVSDQDARSCESATDRALAFLDGRDPDRPFFLMAGYFEPHRPWTDAWPNLQSPAAVTVPPYLPETEQSKAEMSLFYGEGSRTDESAGRIVDKLDELGIRDNTLMIFTTDHGIAMPYAKGTLYDPGLKIACILSWPGVIAAGTRYDALSSNVDLLPTIMEAADRLDLIPPDIDGLSLWAGLTNGAECDRDHVYAEMSWHDFYEPMRGIRTESHKLIRNFEPGTGLQLARDITSSPIVLEIRESLLSHPHPEYELYELGKDPLERNNLAGQADVRDLETRLKSDLNAWLRATADPILDGRIVPPRQYFPVMDTDWTRRLP